MTHVYSDHQTCMYTCCVICTSVWCTCTDSYLDLEGLDFLRCEGVGLGDDRDDVHQIMELLHKLNVQRLQSAGTGRVGGGGGWGSGRGRQ